MKILFVKTHSIGDVLLTTASMCSVIKSCEEAEKWCLTSGKCIPVLSGTGHSLHYLELRKDKIGYINLLCSFLSFIRRFGLRSFDKAYVYSPSILTILFTYLLSGETFCLRGKNRITGWLLNLLNIKSSEWIPRGKYILKVYNSVSELDGIKSLYSRPFIDENLYDKFHNINLDFLKSGGYISFFPGGGINIRERNIYKRLKKDKTIKIVKALYEKGFDNVIIGGDKYDDTLLADEKAFLETSFNTRIIAGLTDIHDLVLFIKKSSVVITTDSLPLHIAVALEKPTVALFGPSDEKSLLPHDLRNIYIARGETECSPCYANSTFRGCKLDGLCTERIDNNKIVTLVQEIYNSN